MTRSILTSFSAGELSPDLYPSVELDKHRAGLKVCSNMIVDALGGVKNAPGTEYIDKCSDSTEQSRLIPFQFNTEQAYGLEFGDSTMRIFKDGGLIPEDIVDAAYKWTLSGSGTSEYYLELAAGGDPSKQLPTFVLEDGVTMNQDAVGFLVAGEWAYGDNDTLGFNTIYVRLSDSTDPDSKAQGYVQIPLVVTSPYPIGHIAALNYTPSADTLYVFHPSHKRYKVTRTSDTAWTITKIEGIDGPYLPRVAGDSDVKIKMTLSSGVIWDLEADTAIFADVEIGEPLRLGFPVPGDLSAIYWGWYLVSGITDDQNIEVTQQEDTHPVYQQVQNPLFLKGLEFWEDISALSPPAAPPPITLSYDFTNQAAKLFQPAIGNTKMEQGVVTFSNIRHDFVINISAMTGATPTVTIRVGTATGLGDIYVSPAPITTPTLVTTEIIPSQGVVYINFDLTGSTAGDSVSIDQVELFPHGFASGSTNEYATTDWRLSAWNETYGYPERGVIHEQRLFSAGNSAEPQTIWASELGDFENHGFNSPGIDTDAFSFFPPTPQINGIDWLALQNGLNVGTSDSVWKVFAASGGVITPTDVNIKIDSAVGTLDLAPLTIGNSMLLTPRGLSAVTELTSSLEASGQVPRDVSVLARHLFENRRIVRWAYAKNPDSIIWCVLDDGTLLGMTYLKEYDIWAWFTRTTDFGKGYKDIIVIPNSNDDNIDDVYFVVNRGGKEVPGTPPTFPNAFLIEKLNTRITPQTAAFGLSASGTPYDYRFLDSAITYDNPKTITAITKASTAVVTSASHGYSNGNLIRIQNVEGMTEVNNVVYKVAGASANNYSLNDEDDNPIDSTLFSTYESGGESRLMVTTLSGLEHLNGETVNALADGSVETGLTVVGGSVTLSQAASFVHIGVPYTSEIETLDLEILANTGSTQGRKKSITGVTVFFKDTRGAEVATSGRNVYKPIAFMHESDGENPTPLFTGSKEKISTSNYRPQERIKIRQTEPLPMHILRMAVDVDYER